MPSARLCALVFCGLLGVVAAFQLALALGAPWGAYAMGGAFPGAWPPAMRVAALVEIAVLAGVGLIVVVRAGLALPRWRGVSRGAIWIVVGLLAVSVVLNLITPSALERAIWEPVALALFFSALRVALSSR